MTESQEWVLLGVVMVVGAVLTMFVAMWAYNWIAGILHRRKTRRQRFHW